MTQYVFYFLSFLAILSALMVVISRTLFIVCCI